MNLGMSGRIAVITGGSQGLGYATAESMVREGASVAIGARDNDALDKAAASLTAINSDVSVLALPLDVTVPSSIDDFARSVREELGDPDILVSNAGGPRSGTYDDIPTDAYPEAIELCFLFAVRLFEQFLPAMRKKGYGRIVHIGSISARQPLNGLILSNATRAAMIGFAKTVSSQVAKDGVTVNVILPGFTATDRTIELAEVMAKRASTKPDEIVSGWESQIPAGRLGRPEEIGNAITWLCSEPASYITGVSLAVDGGFVKGIP